MIAALGCGDPRGDLPLIHHSAASGTAILTMVAGVKHSPPLISDISDIRSCQAFFNTSNQSHLGSSKKWLTQS
jgi:hypothetical protein